MQLSGLVPAIFFTLCALCAQSAQGGPAPQFVWQGQVDGVAILHLRGKHLEVQIQEGAPVERQQFHFSDALPDSGQIVRVDVLQGRGFVHVIDQPGIENRYTLAVGIEDRQPGSSFYSIALYWDTSNNAYDRGAAKADKLTWSGRVEHAAVIDCRKQTCVSRSEHGTPVANEHFKFSKPLPGRDTEVRLEGQDGRGEIRLIEQPRESNQYTARVAIHDPLAGATDYSFTLAWNRANAKEPVQIPESVGRGLLWTGRVDGRVRVTIQGGASFSEALEGERVVAEHAEMFRPLPARSDLMPAIRKLAGRGQVAIVEAPSEKNNYQLVFEIDDPEPGADDYEVELDW
ncbi:MAG: hypothetical protein ABSH31_08125 [Bryobacteraceae bacterium]